MQMILQGFGQRDMPRAECWCFGFHARDISIAGKQQGFAGQRSSLFLKLQALLEDRRKKINPSCLLIEKTLKLYF